MTNRNGINHAEIEELSSQLFDDETRQVFSEVASHAISIATARFLGNPIDSTLVSRVRQLVLRVDTIIGGIGIDRLHVPLEDRFTGDYSIDERAVYRPLQYALDGVLYGTHPRYSIHMSCQHIESVLKRRCDHTLPNIDHAPLGAIISRIKSRKLLNGKILHQLEMIAQVLNLAKHEFSAKAIRIQDSSQHTESQVFSTQEAVSMYFICRKIGVQLQTGSY